jgi:histidinol-phosphatase
VNDTDLQLAFDLVDEAASIAMSYFGRETHVETKADGSPVGEADLAVDAALGRALRAARPGDAVLSEESGESPGGGRRWIVDPIDGTRAFLAGREHWGTHMALEEDGVVTLGVISRPVTGDRWWATKGGGAWHSDRNGTSPAAERVSRVSSLAEARVTGWDWSGMPSGFDALHSVGTWEKCRYNELLIVLDGRAEIMLVPGRTWDHAPFVILLREAGAGFLDPSGGERIDLGGALYTNGFVDEELRRLLWP